MTGAQGVGKSTFCNTLARELKEACEVHVLPSIGEGLKKRGIPFGSAATSASVLAIYCAHLERERMSPQQGLIILDRCAADALCYTRSLAVNSDIEIGLLTETSHLMAKDLDLIIHLEMTGIFENSAATHESENLRSSVAANFPIVLKELASPFRSINAADEFAVRAVCDEIREIIRASGLSDPV